MMVAMLKDMLFIYRFLTTPMDLESYDSFRARLTEADERHVELDKVRRKIMLAISQKEPIPSVLSK